MANLDVDESQAIICKRTHRLPQEGKFLGKVSFSIILKAEEELAMEATLKTMKITQQIMEAQFKQFQANMEIIKLMKEQAVVPVLVPADGGVLKPPLS